MNEYRFQYTKLSDTLFILLASVLSYILSMAILVFVISIFYDSSENMVILVSFLSIIPAFFVFRGLKKRAVRNCIALLNSDSVVFELKNDLVRRINFDDLNSYEFYSGKNGPVLYLRNNINTFKIFANDNFCDPEPLETFSKDIIAQLDKYRIENNLNITNGGNVLQRKGTLTFLIISTVLVLFLFYITTTDLIESADLNVRIKIFGGSFLVVSWIMYFVEMRKKKKNNPSNT